MHALFEKLRRFSVCFLTMWVSLALVGSFPVTASGQTTAIAADEGTGVLLAGFHPKPPKFKKPSKPKAPSVRVRVPKVTGKSRRIAETILRGLGFSVSVERQRVTTEYSVYDKKVARQNPAAKTRVKPGTRVKLTLYRFKAGTASPKGPGGKSRPYAYCPSGVKSGTYGPREKGHFICFRTKVKWSFVSYRKCVFPGKLRNPPDEADNGGDQCTAPGGIVKGPALPCRPGLTLHIKRNRKRDRCDKKKTSTVYIEPRIKK